MYDTIAQKATIFSHGRRAEFSYRLGAMGRQSKVALELKRLRERAKMSVREMATALDDMAPSTYASYEDKYKKTFLPMELVKKLVPILSKRGVDREDILALAGVSDPDDVHAVVKEITPTRSGAGTANVDELEVSPSAGDGDLAESQAVIRTWTFPRDLVTIATESALDRVKIVRVKGDSMAPTYNALDRIMVDTDDKTPSPGGVFVVWDGLGLVVKRVQLVPHSEPLKVLISSDNAQYKPYERTLDEAYIQGRVIGKWLWV